MNAAPSTDRPWRVGSATDVKQLAGAVAKAVRDDRAVVVLAAIGAGAVNQAVKSLACARGMLAEDGWDITAQPSFVDIVIPPDKDRTAIHLTVTGAPAAADPAVLEAVS